VKVRIGLGPDHTCTEHIEQEGIPAVAWRAATLQHDDAIEPDPVRTGHTERPVIRLLCAATGNQDVAPESQGFGEDELEGARLAAPEGNAGEIVSLDVERPYTSVRSQVRSLVQRGRKLCDPGAR
jgi:hypothetical protein